jgi:minor extracellular serine protease Vpr
MYRICAFLVLLAALAAAQPAGNRYALILEDPPVAAQITSKDTARSAVAQSQRQRIESRQRTLKAELVNRRILVTGSANTLANAVFVTAPADRVPELKNLPGVIGVVPLRRYHRNLSRAVQLVNGPAAWNALGGIQNAGAGMKIGILDSGIDQTHPAFQDSSLPMPGGYPICSGADCAFTNNKVIVARSYVAQLAAGSSPDPAADSRPDDTSPRDRDGHGTAVASVAAGNVNTGSITFNGMAPKAYLGNYKIYGSPGVNDSTTDDIIIQALEDAFNDGMDVINFSSGGPAFSGPLDTGAACGNDAGVPCDLVAQTFELAARKGLIIVAASGNEGDNGTHYPTLNSVGSPGDAPSVIAPGATTNSHSFAEDVTVPGPGIPANLQAIAVRSGDAGVPTGAVTAVLRDVTQVGNDGFGCSALPAASLVGTIALIERSPAGGCSFATKLSNAEDAGAVAVIFYMADQSALISPSGLSNSGIPAVLISNADGLALKDLLTSSPSHLVTIDPEGIEQNATANLLAGFSSRGPTTGDAALKPDLVAPGTSIYMAAENYDPLGELYSSNRYAAADGTSFATPIVAGAAALVKQKHPSYTAAQVKSALVNTASQDVMSDDSGNNPVGIESLGAGKLDAGASVADTVTVTPSSVSFGAISGSTLPKPQPLQITNGGAAAVNLTLAVTTVRQSSAARIAIDKQSLTLAPGASAALNVSLSGSAPSPGLYSGVITISGAGVPLRVPYLFAAGSGVASNIIPLTGTDFDGTVNGGISDGIISFKLVDANGIAVPKAAVSFQSRGGGTLKNADTTTDNYGIAAAEPVLGSQPGNYSYVATAGGQRFTFSGFARAVPAITPAGVVNSASSDNTIAPGSYITIFGANLSDFTDYAETAALPLAIDQVNVSFDVPAAGISVPGRLAYASSTQVNVQVPWELQGQSAAQVKVTINYTKGNVITIPLSDFAPALFEASPGAAAALDGNFRLITASNPARRGQVVQLFANGLGPVNNQPATGDPAPASPLATTKSIAVVSIGGQPAQVLFSGLAPGFAGLYQVNVTVPPSVATGSQPVTIMIGGRTSKASGIVVQ